MIETLPFTASADVREALDRIGRTEDVVFSPDNRRLAVAGYGAGIVLLIDIDIDFAAAARRIALAGATVVTSPGLREPHGVAFIDDLRLLVADRSGSVSILTLPPPGSGLRDVALVGPRLDAGNQSVRLSSPGSVAVVKLAADEAEVLVCNNYIHQVTSHRLRLDGDLGVGRSTVLIQRKLSIPDGVAVSPSRQWIAVSNHTTRSVLVYRRGLWLGPRTRPAGILTGVAYPHGVRFTADGRFLLVADAGAPFVYVYASPSGRWRGTRHPSHVIRVMEDEAFRSGQTEPAEGGPKGIDVDHDGNVLVATSHQLGLAFFALPQELRARRKGFV
jgi:DNA-binding beta-propeller fold protein YncE